MLNSTEVVVHFKTNFVKVIRKSIVVPETIGARQLILSDRHVTYREIEATLGISWTSIHSILQEHLTVKKICSRWILHNLSIVQKRFVSSDRKKCSKNSIALLRNTSLSSRYVMDGGFTRMSLKANSSLFYGCFQMRKIQRKLLTHKALPSK